jgi:hypothetical protein
MSQALRLMLNRGLTDKGFSDLLVRQPDLAVRDYELEQAERQALLSRSVSSYIDLVVWLRYLELAGNFNFEGS